MFPRIEVNKMHELSIALGIVKIAEEETKKAKAAAVERIELVVGALSGVELRALKYVWPVAIKDTVLSDASLEIEYIEAEAECMDCNCVFTLKNVYDNCPECKSYLKNITKGKELKVKALEVT